MRTLPDSSDAGKESCDVGGNCNVGIHGTLNGQDFPDLAASEFVEADVTVSILSGGLKK